jgi:hypothetical protein
MTAVDSEATASRHAEKILDEVRGRIAPENSVLKAARERRDAVKTIAMRFHGTARCFNSGSVAHATANDPVSDADCGVVLDRRSYPELGPEGGGAGPVPIVRALAEEVTPEIKKLYRDASVTTTKRAVLVEVNEPIDDEDPSVDLIVGLTRKQDSALWIPHLDANRWDPSHPERHTALLTADPAELRVHRARVLRLAKAAVCNDGDERVMCSFNIEALALTYVMGLLPTLSESLELLFASASRSIEKALTPDPAGVSKPIKLPEGITREAASKRLAYFATCVKQAREAPTRQQARSVLEQIYGPQLAARSQTAKSSIADELRRQERGAATVSAFGVAAAGLKPTRSFGHRR